MHAMWLSKVKVAAGAALILAGLGAGTGWVLMPATAQDDSKTSAEKAVAQNTTLPPKNSEQTADKEALELLQKSILKVRTPSPLAAKNPEDNALRELVKERYRTAIRELGLRLEVFQAGARGGMIDVLLGAVQRAFESELALSPWGHHQDEARKKNLERLQAIVAVNRARFNVGQIAQQDLEQCKFQLLEAEIKIAELQPIGPPGK
jgi:hypothetical protein